jgi:hypothetical protein
MEKPNLFNRDFQKEQSEKYKYKHIHTGEYCTFEAYVAEFIVLRRAERLCLPRPGYKFWTKGDPNHWIWMKQMHAARALAEKYSEEAVLSVINSDDFKKYLLIGLQNGRGWKINPVIENLVAKHYKIIEAKRKTESKEFKEVVENPVRRVGKQATGISILNKLRGKDGKEKGSTE